MGEIRSIDTEKVLWIDILNPGEEEMEFLKEKFDFHTLALEDCLSTIERPKIDDYDDYIFIVLHFPAFNFSTRRLDTAEINIFVGEDYLVTLHQGNLKAHKILFEDFIEKEDIRTKILNKSSGFLLYEILDSLLGRCFPILSKMNRNIEGLEQEIFGGHPSRFINREMMIIKRNILNYRKIIKPQRAVLRTLENKTKRFLPEELDDYFGDLGDQSEKIWDVLENYKELVEGLNEANETLISHQVNNIMKVLTIFSVILLPLTLLSGIYGMNVNLPFDEFQHAFFIVIAIMLSISSCMIFYFKKKGWL